MQELDPHTLGRRLESYWTHIFLIRREIIFLGFLQLTLLCMYYFQNYLKKKMHYPI
jgi:hypothetical protein